MPVASLENFHGMHQVWDMISPLAGPIYLHGGAQNHGYNLPITIIISSSRDTVHLKLDMEAMVMEVQAVMRQQVDNGEATHRPVAINNLKIILTMRHTIKANMPNSSANLRRLDNHSLATPLTIS